MEHDLKVLYSKILYNLEDGNYREALYFTDLALYELQNEDYPDIESKLKKVLLLKGKALQGLHRNSEASECFSRAGTSV